MYSKHTVISVYSMPIFNYTGNIPCYPLLKEHKQRLKSLLVKHHDVSDARNFATMAVAEVNSSGFGGNHS